MNCFLLGNLPFIWVNFGKRWREKGLARAHPLFFCTVVEIERFALRAGILDDLIRERGTVTSPEPRPLGTYEIKIAVCTGKPSILTILRNLGDCQQWGGGGQGEGVIGEMALLL